MDGYIPSIKAQQRKIILSHAISITGAVGIVLLQLDTELGKILLSHAIPITGWIGIFLLQFNTELGRLVLNVVVLSHCVAHNLSVFLELAPIDLTSSLFPVLLT